jgi:uncharacterized protein
MSRHLCWALVLAGCAAEQGAAPTAAEAAPQRELSFSTDKGAVAVKIEVAKTPAEQQRGLMFRRELLPNAGMLFVFAKEEEHRFWMKNTYVSLDMIFIDKDKRVVGVAPNTTPLSTDTVTVGEPSTYVLEVVAGFAALHGVTRGTQAYFEDFPVGL